MTDEILIKINLVIKTTTNFVQNKYQQTVHLRIISADDCGN